MTGNFLLLTITWILMFFASPIPNTYASIFYEDVLGANDFILAVIGFAASIALALVQFPGGYLADKHGRRWLVYTMTFGVAASSLFFIFAPTWQFILLATMIQNFCLLYQPALFAIMLDSVSPENRGAGFTIQSVVTSLAGLPASIIAGYLILVFQLNIGMRIAYAIVAVAYFTAAFLRVNLKETLPSDKGSGRPNLLAAFREYPRTAKDSVRVWSQVPRSAFYLFISTLVVNSLIAGCSIYFVVYATGPLGIAKFQWALVMAFMSISIAVPAIVAGLRMDRVGRKSFLLLGYLCYLPAMILFINADFNTLLLAFFLYGLGQVLQTSSYNSLVGDLTPRELRGKVVGCSQFFIYLGQAFTQLLMGSLYAYVWRPLPFIMLAAGGAAAAVFAALKITEPRTKEI
jgi:MFS family permease